MSPPTNQPTEPGTDPGTPAIDMILERYSQTSARHYAPHMPPSPQGGDDAHMRTALTELLAPSKPGGAALPSVPSVPERNRGPWHRGALDLASRCGCGVRGSCIALRVSSRKLVVVGCGVLRGGPRSGTRGVIAGVPRRCAECAVRRCADHLCHAGPQSWNTTVHLVKPSTDHFDYHTNEITALLTSR